MKPLEIYENFPHVMLDIESLDNKSGSVITSLAAVRFDMLSGDCYEEFYRNIDIQSCLNSGLRVGGDTIEWWFNQSEAARKKLFDPKPISLSQALYEFGMWYKEKVGKRSNIWGNSNRFDMGLLSDAYEAANKTVPWDWRMEKDVRTLASFGIDIKMNEEFKGTPHNSIDDCKHQIAYCSKTYNRIRPTLVV